MKGAIAVCLLLAFLGLAAAAPSTPLWPKQFSATVVIWNVSNAQQPPDFLRWFQDIPQNVSRRDQIVQIDPKIPPAFVKVVVNGTTRQERAVYDLPDGTMGCIQRQITRHLINPDFSQFTYFGIVYINNAAVNQWNARTNTSFVSYFENTSSREPVRFRGFSPSGNEEIINFSEFDATPQDPNLFVLPSWLVCNTAPTNEMYVKLKH